MSQNPIITVSLNSVEETSVFGNAFGSHFLHPLVHAPNPEDRQSLVIGAFGASQSGKTAFLKPSATAAAGENEVPFVWDRMQKEEFSSGDLVFRRTDFAVIAATEQVFPQIPHFAEAAKELRKRAIEGVYFPRRTKQEGPGIDFFEHPPIAYMQSSNVIVITASTSPFVMKQQHGRYMLGVVQKEEAELKKNPDVSLKDILGLQKTADTIIVNMMDVELEINQQLARYGPDRPFNIIRVVLTDETPRARAAFNNFRAEAIKALDLVR